MKINYKFIGSSRKALPVVHENIGTLDVTMQEVLAVTVIQAVQQLLHNARIVHLVEIDHSRFQQAHQVVIHVFEHQIKRPLVLRNTKERVTSINLRAPIQLDAVHVKVTQKVDVSDFVEYVRYTRSGRHNMTIYQVSNLKIIRYLCYERFCFREVLKGFEYKNFVETFYTVLLISRKMLREFNLARILRKVGGNPIH